MSGNESPEQLIKRIGKKPTLTSYAGKGFHGTSEVNAASILQNGVDVARSREGFYGKGFYFYEDNAPHPGVEAAANFLRTWRKSVDRIAVLVFEIAVSGNFLLDLVAIPENRELFDRLQEELINMAAHAGEIGKIDPRLIGTATAEFIVRYCPEARVVHAIRATFEMRNMTPGHQRGGCIRHAKCIAKPVQIAVV